jgi:hypothetical protein
MAIQRKGAKTLRDPIILASKEMNQRKNRLS